MNILNIKNILPQNIAYDGVAIAIATYILSPTEQKIKNTFIVGTIHWILHSNIVKTIKENCQHATQQRIKNPIEPVSRFNRGFSKDFGTHYEGRNVVKYNKIPSGINRELDRHAKEILYKNRSGTGFTFI
jgi:type III secretory pathway component EscR